MFDKTIENIKKTQTLSFIVIVMISLFLISYLACQQNLYKKIPPSPIRKEKGCSTNFFLCGLMDTYYYDYYLY